MKRTLIFSLAAASGILLLTQCQKSTAEREEDSKSRPEQSFGGYASKEELGKHLVGIAGCHDCHTPRKMGPMGPVFDMDRALSGHPAAQPLPDLDRKDLESKGAAATQGLTAWIGPWGVSYVANITSSETGIGSWTLEQFTTALREGKSKGLATNRNLMPPMPLMLDLSDLEIEAIYAYLQSTRPVENIVPQPLPPVMAIGQ